MTVHVHSIDAYRKLVNGHQMSDRRYAAMSALLIDPGATANEVHARAGRDRRNNMGARLIELELMGLVRRGDGRRCRVSGQECITWWPRAELPAELLLIKSNPYRHQTPGARLKQLEIEVERWRQAFLNLRRTLGVTEDQDDRG